VELLDIVTLFEQSPPSFYAREDLRKGRVADPRSLIAEAFEANYVLCRDPGIVAQLNTDPSFSRLYPLGGAGGTALFRVAKKTSPRFVRGFFVNALPPLPPGAAQELKPSAKIRETPVVDLGDLAYLNLFQTNVQAPPGSAACAFVAMPPAETKRLAGARYLGFGGGPSGRIWINGKLIFTSEGNYPRARSIQAVVPLERALGPRDQVDLLVCSNATPPYWGLSLSAWSEEDFMQACRRNGEGKAISAQWQTTQLDTCLGPMARPAVPGGLRGH